MASRAAEAGSRSQVEDSVRCIHCIDCQGEVCMKSSWSMVIGSAVALATGIASAQYVKGNEAVKVMPDGSKRVEMPPTAGALLAKPCPATKAGCAGGGWMMVETPEGLLECTEIYARPGTCRTSTFGSEKRSRLWIVK